MYNDGVPKSIYRYGKYAGPLIVFAAGLLFLLVGLGSDRAVSEALFGFLPSLVVTLVSVIVPLPFFALLGMAGALLGVALRKKKDILPWYAYVVAVAFSVASGLLFGHLVISEHIESALLSYVLGPIVVTLIDIPFMLLEKDAEQELAIRLASSILVPALFALALLFTLRLAVARPGYGGESVEPTAFPAMIPLFATASFAGVPLLALLVENRDKGLFAASASLAVLSLLSALTTLSSGASYLSDIGFSFMVGSLLASAFPFLFLVPYFARKERKVAVRKSPVTAAIRRRQVADLRAKAEANALRMRRKNNSFKAVVPLSETSLLSRRRNYLHHK